MLGAVHELEPAVLACRNIPMKTGCVLYVFFYIAIGTCLRSVASTVPPTGGERIQFGNRLPGGKGGYYVPIETKDGKGVTYYCGASIVSSRVLLSAAHCFYDDNGRLVALQIKAYVYGDSKPPILADGVIKPTQFHVKQSGSFYGDVALIHLSKSIVGKTPVRLARSLPKTGTQLIVIGRGATEDADYSPVTQYADVPLLSRSASEGFYGGPIEKDHFGAGYDSDYQDSCGGDSGGPIVLARTWNDQVGVVSYGVTDCGDIPSVGFYTSVPYWYSWITNTIKKGKYTPL